MSDPLEDTDAAGSNFILESKTSERVENRELDGSTPSPAIAGKEYHRPQEIVGVGADVAEASRRGEESLDVTVAVAAPKSGEKKVGTLLAAAMKKYAVPRSSCYHGVTKLKWSGKFEAHLWDNTSQVEGRKRKGKHVYLGSYDSEEKAARAHDLAALKYWGPTPSAKLNFPVSDYERELETMKNMSQDEYVAHVRRYPLMKQNCLCRAVVSLEELQPIGE